MFGKNYKQTGYNPEAFWFQIGVADDEKTQHSMHIAVNKNKARQVSAYLVVKYHWHDEMKCIPMMLTDTIKPKYYHIKL